MTFVPQEIVHFSRSLAGMWVNFIVDDDPLLELGIEKYWSSHRISAFAVFPLLDHLSSATAPCPQ